jgi:uncharacterized protein YcaQ
MTAPSISKQRARQLAIQAQLLDGKYRPPSGREGVAHTIERLGYVQIDTISVIQRAHHHTLWTRLPQYQEPMLHELQLNDRRVFEYWGHAASYLPMSDFRFYRWKMEHRQANPSVRTKQWTEKNGNLLELVLNRVRREGPLSTSDFEAPPNRKSEGWWDWKPAKSALEILFWNGDLMISHRENFKRIYDLPERVLPSGIDTSLPSEAEFARFLVRRALRAYGVATQGEIFEHIRGGSRSMVAAAIQELTDAGEVVQVKISSQNSYDYALTEAVDPTGWGGRRKRKVSLLSPFDNLIIQRERTRRLFDFDYVLECYTPAAKRKYGYFVLPVLWGTKLVARLDPKANRKTKVFEIRNLVFEPEFEEFDELLPLLAQKMVHLARSNGCESFEFIRVKPAKYKRELRRLTREDMVS